MSSNESRDELAEILSDEPPIHVAASRALEKMYGEWGTTPGLPTPAVAMHRMADFLDGEGWRPPPRALETAEAIAAEPTGTVIRSRHGDIGSIDHGPRGEWIGPGTLVHLLDPGVGMGLSVADLMDPELASTFPYLVLWEPEEAGRG